MKLDECANCGGSEGLHHYQTNQCPVGGVEARFDREQEYKTTTFAPIPFAPPERLAKDMTVREYFAAMAMQGLLNRGHVQHSHNFAALMDDAVLATDALIEALNKEQPNVS